MMEKLTKDVAKALPKKTVKATEKQKDLALGLMGTMHPSENEAVLQFFFKHIFMARDERCLTQDGFNG